MSGTQPPSVVPRPLSAFTLIELLVVVSIMGIIAGLAFPTLGKVRGQGFMVRELSAGKQLMAGFALYPADHDGQLLPGYRADPAQDDRGHIIPFPENARYPWRIAPYLDYRTAGILVVNDQVAVLKDANYAYSVSVFPSLGMNSTFVGGDYGDSAELPANDVAVQKYGKFFVARVGEAFSPTRLIVFASARYKVGAKSSQGYFQVVAPFLTGSRWTKDFSENDPAVSFGFVHPRWGGRAVAAMLDGHSELLDQTQLKDMRRWSNQAAIADNPTWTLTRP